MFFLGQTRSSCLEAAAFKKKNKDIDKNRTTNEVAFSFFSLSLSQTSLTYVYGIGPTTAKTIMTNTGIENKRVKDLSEEELTKLRKEVEDGGYLIEGKIRRHRDR